MGTWTAITCLVALTACGRIAFDGIRADDGDDASDLCPRPSCTGHDEDGDGVPDQCDLCPTVPDDQCDLGESSAGLVADGIGDACDPHPALPGDHVVYFTPFVDVNEVETNRIQSIGVYSISNDVLHLGATSSSSSGGRLTGVPDFSRAMFGYKVISAAPQPAVKWAGLWTHVGAGFDLSNAMFAQASQSNAGFAIYYMKQAVNNVDHSSPQIQGRTLDAGRDVTMTIDTDPAPGGTVRLSCVVDGTPLDLTQSTIMLPQTGTFYFENRLLQADYAYLIIYAFDP